MGPATNPGPWARSAIAYDSAAGRLVLYGAGPDYNETWAYDFANDSWINRAPSVNPLGANPEALTYDARADRIISLGTVTWAYEYIANAWSQIDAFPNPVDGAMSLLGPSMAYNPRAERIILFGGALLGSMMVPPQTINQTWAFDYANQTWTNLRPSASPRDRYLAGMVYDSRLDKMLLFGGTTNGPAGRVSMNDTWAYDYETNTWTNLTQPYAPPVRNGHAMAYDSRADRVVLFGGGDAPFPEQPVPNNETWTYDPNGNAWTRMTLGSSPRARMAHAMAYDAQSDQLILYGGWANVTAPAYNDTWTYQPANPPTVMILSPSDGAVLQSTSIDVSGTASGDVTIEKVKLSIDGIEWAWASGTTSWSGTLAVAEGLVTVFARATDASGASTTTHVTVTISIEDPGDGSSYWWVFPASGIAIAGIAGSAAILILRRRRHG